MKNPIWLLPGFLGDENHWGNFPTVLAQHLGVMPEVFDWFKETSGAKTLPQAGQFLAQRAYAEGLRPVLIGYSMGGRLALQAAICAPGAFSAVVAVSAHPGFAQDAEKDKRQKDDLVWGKLLREDFDLFWEKWNARGVLQNTTHPTRPQITSEARESWTLALENLGTGKQDYFPPQLEDLPLPVSVIVGANDTAYVKHLADFPVGVEKHIVTNAGHRVPLEAPAELAQAITPFVLKSQDIL